MAKEPQRVAPVTFMDRVNKRPAGHPSETEEEAPAPKLSDYYRKTKGPGDPPAPERNEFRDKVLADRAEAEALRHPSQGNVADDYPATDIPDVGTE